MRRGRRWESAGLIIMKSETLACMSDDRASGSPGMPCREIKRIGRADPGI